MPGELRFVPECLVVYVLKHSDYFDRACINCRCIGTDEECAGGPGGKFQNAVGETGIDFVGTLNARGHRALGLSHHAPKRLVLEVKGDRTIGSGAKLNRPACNEMAGSLCAFLMANLDRVASDVTSLYGWAFTNTMLSDRNVSAFRKAVENLSLAVPKSRRFLLITVDNGEMLQRLPRALREFAAQWYRSSEKERNALLRNTLNARHPGIGGTAIEAMSFKVVTGRRDSCRALG